MVSLTQFIFSSHVAILKNQPKGTSAPNKSVPILLQTFKAKHAHKGTKYQLNSRNTQTNLHIWDCNNNSNNNNPFSKHDPVKDQFQF